VIDPQLTVLFVAYHTLAEKRILHREISENNVLMSLKDGRGLLIDLDLAQDLDKYLPHSSLQRLSPFIRYQFSLQTTKRL
jgi:hypothetical protein